MAIEFKKKESVRKAVKRLGRRHIDKALEELAHCERLEAVHGVRKRIKALRALLRLVRAAMASSDYRRCTETLREAARHLGAARDAHVKVNALAALATHFKPELAARSFHQIKAILIADCRKQQAALSQKGTTKTVGRILKRLAGEFTSLRIRCAGWRALAPGIKRGYRAGRCGYQLARQGGAPEHFHEWRKRVKDLYYQLDLLCPIWPEQMTATENELKQLGECLGDDHDLFLLTEPRIIKRIRKQAPEEAEALKALAEERQKELRAQALAAGARFYQEKPSAFCKRLGQYWKRWRREPKRLLQGH